MSGTFLNLFADQHTALFYNMTYKSENPIQGRNLNFFVLDFDDILPLHIFC